MDSPAAADIPWTPSGDAVDKLWAGDGEADPFSQTVPDMLATMFAVQHRTLEGARELEISNGSPPARADSYGTIDATVVQNRLHELFGYTVREFGEAMGLLKNKPWKQVLKTTDRAEFVEEVTDTWLFFIEFCIVAGITPDELFMEFIRKTNVVVERRKDGSW